MLDETSGERLAVVGVDGEVSAVDRVANNSSPATFARLDSVDFDLPLDSQRDQYMHLVVALRECIDL